MLRKIVNVNEDNKMAVPQPMRTKHKIRDHANLLLLCHSR